MGTLKREPPFLTDNQVNGLPTAQEDWSLSEQSDLGRLREIYPLPHYEIECSMTEDGDPWCVVSDSALDRVIIHIARIGRRYVVVHPEKQLNKVVAQIKTAVDLAIGGNPRTRT